MDGLSFGQGALPGPALPASSRVLFNLAFPPHDLRPGVGPAPALVAGHRVMPRRLEGLASGAGHRRELVSAYRRVPG